MQYRIFNKTGEKVSLMGLGTMRMPQNKDGKLNEKESIELIRHAIDNGVNYIDTAYMYHDGESEVVVGKALKDGYREKVFLADKMPVWYAKEEADVHKMFNTQFERLDVDVIDMYLLHNVTVPIWKIAKKYNTLDFIEKKKAEGKIKHIGFSFHDHISFFKEVIDSYDWDFCQIQLNYMDTKWQAGLEGLKYAVDKGISVVIMEPLKGGRLTDALPESVEKLFSALDVKRTPAERALRWLANFPEVMTILSGASNITQASENIKTLSDAEINSLSEKELAVIQQVADTYNALIQYDCTSCNYCLPCPQKLNIPQAMNIYNQWFLYAQSKKTKQDFEMYFPKSTSICTDCKACEEKCPQHLNISEMMRKAAKLFE
jgi:predicted aldo/keto reductase-like oxidoreductase